MAIARDCGRKGQKNSVAVREDRRADKVAEAGAALAGLEGVLAEGQQRFVPFDDAARLRREELEAGLAQVDRQRPAPAQFLPDGFSASAGGVWSGVYQLVRPVEDGRRGGRFAAGEDQCLETGGGCQRVALGGPGGSG